jgi:putative transposase
LAGATGVTAACAALGIPRSSLYRARQPARPPGKTARRPPPQRALSAAEQATVRTTLDSARYQDQAPREVYADLLDQGVYLCSWRTMYRVLAQHDEVRERRNQLRHPAYQRPQLVAMQPNQVWSWDITKLRGPATWHYYYLYVMLDVFSRYVVGWLLAERESAALAQELIAVSCAQQGIPADQLTIHADNGGPMQAKSVAQLLLDLGVAKSHSRPHTANDNPFSEAQFKTLKYSPTYPGQFGSLAEARQWGAEFFTWYNDEHHHSGLHLYTPADVHYRRSAEVYQQRQAVMHQAFAAHPERFVRGAPVVLAPPAAVWINPPQGVGQPALGAASDVSWYTEPARTEDKAPLESDLSAVRAAA